jgi:hypothetical protein
LDTISGKTPLIFKEIWVFPSLNGNSPLIFQTQHSVLKEPKKEE